jgi:hypothetical protein
VERPVVLFLNDELWNCFNQLAAALRRDGFAPLRVVTGDARRGRFVRFVERALYRGVVDLDRPDDVARLHALVADGRVVDAQVNEQLLGTIGVESELGRLLSEVTGVAVERRATWIDKLALTEEVRAAGVAVPEQCCADELDPDEAVERFGLPLMLKRRTGTGGTEVRLVRSRDELRPALDSLGGKLEHLFYQRFVDGDLVGYGALRLGDTTRYEFTAREFKSAASPLGPTARVVTTDDADLADSGRRVLERLDCGPLAAIELLRDRDGGLWFIDLSVRAWGNFSSLAGAGVDFPAAYARAIRGASAEGTGPVRSRPGVELRVVPVAAADDVGAPLTRVLARLVRDLAPYVRRFGVRYCAVVIAGVVIQRMSPRP